MHEAGIHYHLSAGVMGFLSVPASKISIKEVGKQVEWSGEGDNCLQKRFRFHVSSWVHRTNLWQAKSLPSLDWPRLKDTKTSKTGVAPPQALPDFSQTLLWLVLSRGSLLVLVGRALGCYLVWYQIFSWRTFRALQGRRELFRYQILSC